MLASAVREDSVDQVSDTQNVVRKPVQVVVTSMPERPEKSIFKDSARLLALAAFLFSASTGSYAAYQTWLNGRIASVDRVSKLMDDYYAKQVTLAGLKPSTQIGLINLLQSQSRGIAAKTVPLAITVQEQLDDGTWQALAQINDAERNLKAAEQAWSASIHNTRDIRTYLFGTRGLALNQIRQGKQKEGFANLDKVIQDVRADVIKENGIDNYMTPAHRDLYEGETQGIWLSALPARECGVLVSRFDRAMALLVSADNTAVENLEVHSLVVSVRISLDRFRKERAACPRANGVPPLADDFCALSENLIASAAIGFSPYKGESDVDGFSFESRANLGGGFCSIDSGGMFHCYWPDEGEQAVKKRNTSLLAALAACPNLGFHTATTQHRDGHSEVSDTSVFVFPRKAQFSVRQSFRKPTATRSEGHWTVVMDIGATSQTGAEP